MEERQQMLVSDDEDEEDDLLHLMPASLGLLSTPSSPCGDVGSQLDKLLFAQRQRPQSHGGIAGPSNFNFKARLALQRHRQGSGRVTRPLNISFKASTKGNVADERSKPRLSLQRHRRGTGRVTRPLNVSLKAFAAASASVENAAEVVLSPRVVEDAERSKPCILPDILASLRSDFMSAKPKMLEDIERLRSPPTPALFPPGWWFAKPSKMVLTSPTPAAQDHQLGLKAQAISDDCIAENTPIKVQSVTEDAVKSTVLPDFPTPALDFQLAVTPGRAVVLAKASEESRKAADDVTIACPIPGVTPDPPFTDLARPPEETKLNAKEDQASTETIPEAERTKLTEDPVSAAPSTPGRAMIFDTAFDESSKAEAPMIMVSCPIPAAESTPKEESSMMVDDAVVFPASLNPATDLQLVTTPGRPNEPSKAEDPMTEATPTPAAQDPTPDRVLTEMAEVKLKPEEQASSENTPSQAKSSPVAEDVVNSPALDLQLAVTPGQEITTVAESSKEPRRKLKRKAAEIVQASPWLKEAGMEWKDGRRCSTRIRSRPLEYWRGERLLYGRVHKTMTTLIGVKHSSPLPPKPKRGDKPKVFKVESFVPDQFEHLVKLAAI